jgi:hypothetical protein
MDGINYAEQVAFENIYWMEQKDMETIFKMRSFC